MLQRIILLLKGVAMGAADVIPGVSGGTIAFITGIYDELLGSINAVNFSIFKIWKNDGFKAVWKKINGNFLLTLFLGIFISALSLATILKHLLEHHDNLVWAFFFGLVVGSIYLVGKMIENWRWQEIVAVLIGAILSYYLTELRPMETSGSYWFVFFAGALAICAMILPGISGAFILLLLGVYYPLLEAVSDLNFKFIVALGLGAIVGLLSFSKFLKWLLDNYRSVTVAALLGLLVGSLNKLWPWKQTLEYRINSHGLKVPFIQENILYSNHPDPQVMTALAFCILGLGIILILSKFNPEKSE